MKKRTTSNPCIRCGQERVVCKVWKERVGESVVINTSMICPNKDCQKLVDADNKKQRDKYITMKKASAQRAIDRRAVNRKVKEEKNKAKK